MVVACVALVVALAGSAFAINGYVDSKGKIHGCVAGDGRLYVVKPGKGCGSKTPLQWSQRGPVGPRGPGAREFDLLVADGTSRTFPNAEATPAKPPIKGLYVGGGCGIPFFGNGFLIRGAGQHDTVGVSGIATYTGKVEPITYEGGPWTYGASAPDLNADVLARNVTQHGPWTHFVLGFHRDSAAKRCGVWGNVTPPGG